MQEGCAAQPYRNRRTYHGVCTETVDKVSLPNVEFLLLLLLGGVIGRAVVGAVVALPGRSAFVPLFAVALRKPVANGARPDEDDEVRPEENE
jgi:hypothetical protein